MNKKGLHLYLHVSGHIDGYDLDRYDGLHARGDQRGYKWMDQTSKTFERDHIYF